MPAAVFRQGGLLRGDRKMPSLVGRQVPVRIGGARGVGQATLRRCAVGEAACRGNRLGGVPVCLVIWMARLCVGADDQARVVGGDLLLVAVGGDDGHVPEPFASLTGVGRLQPEQAHPRGTVPDGGVGQVVDTGRDEDGRVVEVRTQGRAGTVCGYTSGARHPGKQVGNGGTSRVRMRGAGGLAGGVQVAGDQGGQ